MRAIWPAKASKAAHESQRACRNTAGGGDPRKLLQETRKAFERLDVQTGDEKVRDGGLTGLSALTA